MPNARNIETGRFIGLGVSQWEAFAAEHPVVEEWLINRSLGTKEQYGAQLHRFCVDTGISPEEFRDMSRLEARDAAWKYVKPFVGKYNSKAKNLLAALKSFYRNKDGETLPFDSRRGGKHYIPKRRKRASLEHVPSKSEMYRIIDSANNVRDKAILLFLFQAGLRVNALCNLRFRDVEKQLYPADGESPRIPLALKITDDIDTKLRGYYLPFYYTFLQGEAVEALKGYCDKHHKDREGEAPLFYSSIGEPMKKHGVWEVVKRCTRRAGLDPKEVWTHTIRRVFRDVLRHSNLNNDFQEALMGHVIPGSGENYFSRNKPEDLATEYMKINFNRTAPKSRIAAMENELLELRKTKKELAELKVKFQGLSSVRNQSDLIISALFQDPRFERLVFEKLAENRGQLEVREDVKTDGKLTDVKIHKITKTDAEKAFG
jgi:integrase/recombinase XerD